MSEAKKYDRSYKEQSVKLALEIGVKRASEVLKVPYGTLYGWVQAAKNGDLDIVLVKQNCNSFPKNQAERFCQGVRPLLNE